MKNISLRKKNESLLFIIIGVVAIIAAVILFFFLKTNFYKGFAVPLFLVALIQITVGYIVYKRSDSDRIRNVYTYDMNPAELRTKEIPRMQTVNNNFVIYRWVEIALLLAGLLLVYFYRSFPGKELWYGLGIGLAIQAAVMLGADYFAEQRAKKYTVGLQNWLTQQ